MTSSNIKYQKVQDLEEDDIESRKPMIKQSRPKSSSNSKSQFRQARRSAFLFVHNCCAKIRRFACLAQIFILLSLLGLGLYLLLLPGPQPEKNSQGLGSDTLGEEQRINDLLNQNQNRKDSSFKFEQWKDDESDLDQPRYTDTEIWPKIQILTDTSLISGTLSLAPFYNLAAGLVGWINGNGQENEVETCTKPEMFEIKGELNIPDMYKILFPADKKKSKSKVEEPVGGDSTKEKLKIYVVLHSHNDAGWGETFEDYYRHRTKNILDNLLKHLTADPQLKFIWSETSFFDLWWSTLPKEKRDQVKKLVANGQLEFVGGGWVMPDEATPHYLSIVTQLIEGHQWLQQHLNYTPNNGWTVDPFGLSSSSTFLQQRTGFKNTVFSRIHFEVRKFLNNEKKSEFYWRQPWDTTGSTDMFCYQMPYGTYDYRGTCGPEQTEHNPSSRVCLMYSSKYNTKNGGSREEQIAERAGVLLEQFKLKFKLFHTNNLFIPIGADFAWQTEYEWTKDLDNLRDIFKYINSKEEFNTEIKFATLNEYFEATHKDLMENRFSVGTPKDWKTPVFSGDFFTYSDRGEEYWSGYYTSRIFHKASERQLLTLVRSSQLIYTLMAAEVTKAYGNMEFNFLEELLQKIVLARRTLSLFQHHDGITGTSTTYVVRDYALKLFHALHDCHAVIQQSIHVLQNIRQPPLNFKNQLQTMKADEIFYIPIMNKTQSESLWEDELHRVHAMNTEETIVVFNPLAKARKQLVRVRVSHSDVKVVDSNNDEISCEIYPIFKHFNKYQANPEVLTDMDHFELFFVAEFKQMELRTFKIMFDTRPKQQEKKESGVRVQIFNTKSKLSQQFKDIFHIGPSDSNEVSSKGKTIQISNHFYSVNFNENGTAVSVEMKEASYPLNIAFSYYKTRRSGLYLFIPLDKDIPVELMGVEPVIIVVDGVFRSYVEVWYPHIRHRFTLLDHEGLESYEMHIDNVLDIREKSNYELIMKVSTGIKSGKEFFTDSNGFQMMRREQRETLPIQGNYYPVASSAFIEDPNLRLTVLTAQPGGCGSLIPGQLEIMLDRRINQDDNRGIGQGGTDNLETLSSFKLILEKPSAGCKDPSNSKEQNPTSTSSLPLPLLSLQANMQQLNFLHPLLGYKKKSAESTSNSDADGSKPCSDYAVGGKPMPCDIHLLGAVPLASFSDSETSGDTRVFLTTSSQSALLFHRMGIDGRFSSSSKQLLEQCAIASDSTNELTLSKSSNRNPFSFGQLKVKDLFGDLFKDQMMHTSLSLSRKHKYYDGSKTLGLEPMEIYPFIVDYAGIVSDNQGGSERTKIQFNNTMPGLTNSYG